MVTTAEKIHDITEKALNIYHYGSFVYGTFRPGISDIDYIVIVPDECFELDEQQFEYQNCQYSCYTKSTWQQKLADHSVDAIEMVYLPKEYIVKEQYAFNITIDPWKIRESFSRTASNSWVKCKKKLTVEKDFNPNVGKKSLWHALRIINFGIQILTHGQIVDYSSMNHLYDEIVHNDCNDWMYYKEKYQPLYNSLKTQFRQLDKKINEST